MASPFAVGHYFSFKTSGDPAQVVDRFEARQHGDRVTFYRNGAVGCTAPVDSTTARAMESYQFHGKALSGPVLGTIQGNGDIQWSHGYTSRLERKADEYSNDVTPAEYSNNVAPAASTSERGTWTEHRDIDMCRQGDVEIIHNWRSHKTIEDLKRMVEERGYSSITVSSGNPSFGHAALKRFDFQLTPAHCKPISTCCRHPCTIYIYTPPAKKATPATERPSAPPASQPGTQAQSFVFQSVSRNTFDTHGLLYALGTEFGAKPYVSPVRLGAVAVRFSSDCGNYYSRSTGHRPGDESTAADMICGAHAHPGDNATQWSRGAPGAWFVLDLQGRRFTLTHYCYRGDYGGGNNHPRTWELQGSSDGSTWTTLRRHVNDASVTTDRCGSWQVESQGPFSTFRIINQGAPNNLCCSGLEMYGTLATNSPSQTVVGVPLTVQGSPVEPKGKAAGSGTEKPTQAPPLIDIYELLKKELALKGNMVEVVDRACGELGIQRAGFSLAQRARRCYDSLGIPL